MKEYLSKQLMMLAILLFSGISGAFASRTITMNYGMPDTNNPTVLATLPEGSVFVYLSANNSTFNVFNDNSYEFEDGVNVSMRIGIGNPVYQLKSIKINNENVTINNNNEYELPDGDLTINIEFDLIDANQISEITVNYLNGNETANGNVDFKTEGNVWLEAHSGTALKLLKGANYKMYIYIPYNPLCWGVSSVTDNGTPIDCDEQGAYSFSELNENHTVNVNFTERSTEKRNITVQYDNNLAYARISILNNNKVGYETGVANDEPLGAAAGANFDYRVFIDLNNPQQYGISTIQVGGTDAEFTKTSMGGYVDIIGLTEDTTVTVTLEEKETKTITVTWPDGCDFIEMFNQNDFIDPDSYEDKKGVWVLATGSTYRMSISLSEPYTYCPSLTIGNNASVYASYNEDNGRYEYDIENLSSDQQIAVSLAPVQTKDVTVNWGSDNHITVFFDPVYDGENIYATNGQPCQLAEGRSYNMRMKINNNIYELTSIQVDKGDNLINDYNANGFIAFPTVNDAHTVNIGLTKKVDTNTITVTWNNGDICSAKFRDNNWNWYYPRSGVPMEFPQNSTIWLKGIIIEPLLYGIESVTVDNEDVTTQVNNGNEYEFKNLSANHTVNVNFTERSTEKKNITVQYDENHASADIYILNGENVGNGLSVANNMPREAAAGEGFNYRVVIRLDNPQQYGISTIQVGGTDAEFTKTSMGGYVDIIDLTDNTTVTVKLEEKETKTVTVTWPDGCNFIEMFNQNDFIDPYSYEDKEGVWVLATGSTYRMSISLSEPYTYCPSLTIGNNASVYASYNEDNGRYEYDIENLSGDQQIDVSLVPVQTKEVTVNWGSDNHITVFFDPVYGGETIYATNGQPCQLAEGRSYEMRMEINEDIYELTSIQVDKGDNLDYYNANGFIAFPTVNDKHTVNIGLTKKVDTNTITVTWNNGDICYAEFHDENWNWYSLRSGEVMEFPQNSTVWLRAEINNRLVYSIGSVTVDNQDVTTQFKNGDEYQFENLSADHTVNIVFNKAETKTVTVNWDDSNGEGAEIHFTGSNDGLWASNNSQTELPVGATIKMQMKPIAGFKVSGVIVDNELASVTYNTQDQCYEYTFTVSEDNTINIVFEESETFSITVNDFDESVIYDVYLNNSRISPNQSRMFNVGSTVTLRVPAKVSVDNVDYKVTMTLDGTACTLEKDPNNYWYRQYAMTGFAANSVHNIALGTTQIIYHNVTVTFNGIGARLETSSDYYGINSGESYKIEQGESVRLILNIGTGRKLTSVTVNGNPVDYKAGGIVLTEGISGDIAVSVVTEEVESYYVSTTFSGYSQATIFMESDLFEKQVTYGSRFNAGSDVTVTIVPSIGYKVSELVLINDNNGQETNVYDGVEAEKKEYKYVIENLANDCYLRITTAKRSMVGIDDQSYTLNDIGMGTYCSEYDLDFTEIDGITAYIASGFDPSAGSIVLTKVYKVPAGTGIIIKGTPGNYSIPVAATKFFYSNMLVGIVTETKVKEFDGEYTNYILLKKDGDTEPTFYRSSGNGNMPANRAYLQIPSYLLDSSNNNSRITAVFDDEVTPIEDIQTNSDNAKDDDYYNLNGQKVKTVKKGIYIKNGKKVIIR